jgi:ATP-dependent DNA ligase
MEQSKPLARRQGYAMARSLSHFTGSLCPDHSHSIGEAVVSGEDGIAIFNRLHRRRKVTDAMLYAFDLLELNGEDLRSQA